MRVAISTLVGYYNYGNRLQNYALQKVIEDMGHNVVTLRDFTDRTHNMSTKEKVLMVDCKINPNAVRTKKISFL